MPRENIDKIQNLIPYEEVLVQLMEECNELSHAASKLRRVIMGINPTPTTKEEAFKNLYEEYVDVLNCLKVLEIIPNRMILWQFYNKGEKKLERWVERLEGASQK